MSSIILVKVFMEKIFEIKRISVSGINVAFTQIGNGSKNAIICQGWGTNFQLYESIANAISDLYTVTLFDFPGFGRTAEPDQAWGVPEYRTFFEEFAKALDIESAVLLGHSYGGRVIIELASKPKRDLEIEKIVLIDSAGIMPERSGFQKFKTRIYKAKRGFLTSKVIHPLFPEVIDDWKSRQGSEDYRSASQLMKQTLVKSVNYDQRHLLHKIEIPTLLIWGENDDATPVGDARIMEKFLPDSGLVVLPNCGHYSFLEQSAEFNSVLRSFLC